MLTRFSQALVVSVIAFSAVAAQEKRVTVDDFVGTWNIEVMSHQIALVIDKQDATKATGTMMAMGRDTLLKGELSGRTITFTGVKPEGEAAHADPSAIPNHGAAQGTPKPIVVTLQEDGTLTGEMMTNQGPVKWTGEKLKTRKKPAGAGL